MTKLVFRPFRCREALRKCRRDAPPGTICAEMRSPEGGIVGYVNLEIKQWARQLVL